MKRSTLAVTLALVSLIAASVAVAATPNKARTLILQKKHFPPGVRALHPSGEASAGTSGWSVDYSFRSGGRPHKLAVAVIVFPSPALAKQLFNELRGDANPASPKLALPGRPYGNQQVSNHSILGGSRLLVRKGAVIWSLEPQTYMVQSGKTYELTRAQTIALYERYGRKQQQLIEAGT